MKEIKDYLHLYLGCEVQYETYNTTLDGLTNGIAIIGLQRFPYTQRVQVNDIKPILRPLSSINKDEVADLLGVDGFITKGNFCPPFFQLEWKDLNDDWQFKHQYSNQLSAKQLVYLLSKHFDLFDLIDAGLAIDATHAVATPTLA